MPNAKELLESSLENIRGPAAVATLFADDGIVALPTANGRAQRPVDTASASTGKRYKQTYAGVLIAENGKIKLLREAMDTLAAHRALSPD